MAISAFRSGAADILKKPVSSEILLEAVERAVERDFAFRQKDFRIVRYQEFYDALTQREKQILNSVNAGLMNIPNCTAAWFKRTNGRDSSGQRL